MKFSLKNVLPVFVIFSIYATLSFGEDTTKVTVAPTTTTTPTPALEIYNFTIPKNASQPACLKAIFSVQFSINYNAEFEKNNFTSNVKLNLQDLIDYDGECSTNSNTLEIKFRNNWALSLNYTLNNGVYELSGIKVDYVIDSKLFPNASSTEVGAKSVELKNLTEFSASKGNSYKCAAQTTIALSKFVNITISNYQAQPFLDKSKDFDTAIDCPADTTGNSKLVPIIVGSALAVLVVLVLIAYVIGKRKHRPGYQTV